ncbi:MFS transporter [Pigmentiphaga soli]|uniref:MFS transporter n=1 Tax=Pigmentiphaga soli TaxID=1007095 RepID=A0ABP8HD39_9BURK
MTSAADGLPSPRKYWALSAALLAMAMCVLETTITNIALPTISTSLGVEPARAVWIVNAYQLAIVATLLPCASLGEIYGYRRVFGCGVVLFTAGSAGCALAGQFELLLACRLVQGLGAAAVMSVVPALMRFIYSQRQFGRGIGFNALVIAVSSAAGPVVGSGILAVASWPWLFGVNVPLGVYVLAVGMRALPVVDRAARRFDGISAGLSAVFFVALIVGVERLLSAPAMAAGCLALTVAAGFALVRRELPRPAPLLPLDLLRIKIFAYSIGASICAFSAHSIAYIALPFYFMHGMHRSQMETGMLMMMWPLAVAVMAPIAGRLSESVSPARLCALGTGIMAAGIGGLLLVPDGAHNGAILPFMALGGAGFGTFQTPNNRTILTAAPRSRSGSAGGMQGTARQFGMACGAAIAGLAFAALPAHGYIGALGAGVVLLLISSAISLARGGAKFGTQRN